MMSEPETPTLLTAEQISAVVDAMDPEALAFSTIVDALELIDPEARARVLGHAYSRFVPHDDDLGDEPKPRRFWLDELPTERDLMHHGDRDWPITLAELATGEGELTFRLTVDMRFPRSGGHTPQRPDEAVKA